MLPEELMQKLSALGWHYISSRVSSNGLVLHKLGRTMLTSALVRSWEETEERSADGWQFEVENS